MAKLFQVIAGSAHQVGREDRSSALKATCFITLAAVIGSVLVTAIAVMLVGERDWLSAMVLATVLPAMVIIWPTFVLSSRLLAANRHNRLLQQQAREDHLTGLFNRPYLLNMLERELALSQRHNYPVSILLIEVADFTQFLDEHGRALGEQVLRQFAQVIGEKIRESDLFGRFDGAQFLLVLPHTSYDDSTRMGEGLKALAAGISDEAGSLSLQITARLGVASTENSGRNLNSLLNEADYALYQNRNDTLT